MLFLVFLPGVFIHEGAHWLMAKICGLKTAKFRVWPKRQGNQIGLGSVSVEKGGPFIDALVGMAPLIVGTLLIGLISHFIFGADRLADEAATAGDWRGGLKRFADAARVPDALLWAYLLFTICQRHDAQRQRSRTAQAGGAIRHCGRSCSTCCWVYRGDPLLNALRLGAADPARADQRLCVHDPARRRRAGRPLPRSDKLIRM